MAHLLPVDRALERILESTPVLPFEEIPYDQGLGRVLQEEVRSAQDYPAFDKSLMDGYAVIAADLDRAPSSLRVVQEIPAGCDPARLQRVERGTASRIMTGGPLPPGADAVLIVEETEPDGDRPDWVRARSGVRPGANLARRGEDVRRGDLLLRPGQLLTPAEVGVLAACGRTRVRVGGRPRVAVLSTGDELVPPEHTPGPGRIRNSNGPLLVSQARRAGAETRSLGISPDDSPALRARIEEGLGSDLLLISGGVSMGRYDLVGPTLRSIGVELLFDKVAIKPGRPFTFGRKGERLVFGCPGNPVSSYVIFEVFARPALRRMMGHPRPIPATVRARLLNPVRQRAGRAGYFQARAGSTGVRTPDGFGPAGQ